MGALYQVATATVATDGAIALTFPSPGQTNTWTGTVNIPGAGGSETWVAKVGGQPWGTFLGLAAFGPIQCGGSQQISITSSGLAAGTTYTALLIGEEATGSVPAASPLPQPLTLAQITGAISAVQSQIVLASSVTITPTAGNSITNTYTIPQGVHVNALAFFCVASVDNGALVDLQGNVSGFAYYSGRPCANDSQALYTPALRAVIPFAGDYEGSVRVKVTATGVREGISFLYVIGFEGTVPFYLPAPVVASVASASVTAGGSPATILPAIGNGRQYRLWSATILPSLFTGNASYGGTQLLIGSGTTPLIQSWSAPSGAPAIAPPAPLTFPDGEVVGSGSVTIANNAGVCAGTATVAYDYV